MAQVEVKINSVNFICDWKYNITSEDMNCCFCHKDNNDKYQPKSQRKCTLKVYGLVYGKCGHIAHMSCYKEKLIQYNKYGKNIFCDICDICDNGNFFVFDKNLEEPHTQKIYKI